VKHGWRTPAAGVLSGLLFALAFPPREWVLLAPLAPVPWLAALAREESRGRALLSGFLFGMAYWCASIPWIFYVVTHYGGQGAAMGVVCVLLLSAILSEWPAFVAWGVVVSAPPGSGWRIAVFPLLWMGSEHARSFVYGGFPWNLAAHALYRHPVWLQTACVWGVFGVSFLLMATASLLAGAISSRRPSLGLAAGVLVLAAGLVGAARLGRVEEEWPRFTVALLQPDIHEEERRAPDGAARTYRRVIDQGLEAAVSRPRLIVVPESAFPLYWGRSALLRAHLEALAGRSGGSLLFNDVEELPDGSYYNVARLAGSRGLIGPPYRKVHLVPFGEYVPLPRIFFFARQVSSEVGAFSAAAKPAVLADGSLRIGVGVCYEILYPSLSREQVGALGANVLATISNDSWYGRAGAQAQHLAGALLRSVETERYLLRAAITGISAIVDERGRIRGELPADRGGILRGEARSFQTRTPWVRWGFWIPRAADVASIAVLLFGLRRWFRSSRFGASGGQKKT
jgi:apolipoprotein N-acyltransferase